jgi:GAF domain-containing protein/HAMP domain-containing protein
MSTEEFSQRPSTFFRLLNWFLERFGGSFLSIAVFMAEMVSVPIVAMGFLAIQVNAHFTSDQLTATILWALIMLCLADITIIGLMLSLTRSARERLSRWSQGKPLPGGKVEYDSWRQVTLIWWRYAGSVLLGFFLTTVILNIIQYSDWVRASSDQIVYTFLGNMTSAIIIVLITTPVLEAAVRPALVVLRPETIETRLSGGFGAWGLRAKFQSIIMGLIAVAILLVAPIGYQATNLALIQGINGSELLFDLQWEFIVAGAIMLAVGLLASMVLARQLFKPLYELGNAFNRVEKGDLKLRLNPVPFTAFEETNKLVESFNLMLAQIESSQEGLEKRIADRTDQLRASNDVGKIASTILDPDELITQTVNLIANTFSYYFVAIFLVVDNRWAELKDATGTQGEVLKENHHRLPVADSNMVGAAVIKKEAQIALDVGEGAKVVFNPLLPFTRSEITLPLIVGERIIGVLDVQSSREADFNPDNISTLQGMANQVAIAIENARLFKEMDSALEELRQANRQYVVSSWTDKLKGTRLDYTTGSTVSIVGEDTRNVEIGLNLRDQSIGRISLQTDNEWSPEDQAWVESLATQVAISLENARLIEESQGSALRERISASIVQKLWASTTSIDTILQTAVRELGRALEASEATIELKVEDK